MIQIRECIEAFKKAIKPPPKLSLSEWADKYAVLSAESSAEVGRWRTLPYQKGIMDAITDPSIERVTVKKSARVGYTKILNHALAYHIHQDPCSMMVVQPTIEDAEGYSKEEITPMLRDTPVLQGLVTDAKLRDGTNSLLHKLFPGGQLSLVGANSPRGFRRVSRRIVAFDETSGYPTSAGREGSPIKLGIKRTEYFWNRKIIDGSTPGIEGQCAIDKAFNEGDQRYRFLPCPVCGHMQYLKFQNLKWPKDQPRLAYFECEENACTITHDKLRQMDERGEWRSTATPANPKHVSFHIWAAYSYSPNSTWGDIAAEFVASKKDVEALKTFVNTGLGETWQEKGEAPDSQRLYERRELYKQNTLPKGVVFLTAGVDVQKDRIEAEIVGWGRDKQSWSIDYRIEPGDTADLAVWTKVDKLLNETWKTESGRELQIRLLTIDSGYNTQHVYSWARKHSADRVRVIKGSDKSPTIFGTPTQVDVNKDGTRAYKSLRLWHIGVSIIKSELYGWLKLDKPADGLEYPAGYCHFPEYDLEHFKRLASEQLMTKTIKGKTHYNWEKIHERNEQLDCRVYARAAAAMFGIDRFTGNDWNILEGKHELPKPPVNADVVKEEVVKKQDESDSKNTTNDFWARQRHRKKLF